MFTPNEEFTLIYQKNEALIHWKNPEGLIFLWLSGGCSYVTCEKDDVLKGKTKIVLNMISINVYFGYNFFCDKDSIYT